MRRCVAVLFFLYWSAEQNGARKIYSPAFRDPRGLPRRLTGGWVHVAGIRPEIVRWAYRPAPSAIPPGMVREETLYMEGGQSASRLEKPLEILQFPILQRSEVLDVNLYNVLIFLGNSVKRPRAWF